MGTERALTVQPATEGEWSVMLAQAKVLVGTGFLPNYVNTPEKAVAIMLKGRELNIPPMYALSNIVVIQGKPACNSELMLALIYRDHGDDAVQFTESTNARCTISYRRPSWQLRRQYTFTIQDAQTAKLVNETWQKYPAAMLRARCISAVARMAFPDTIGGMYTPEELGAAIRVAEDGSAEVIGMPEAPREAQPEQPAETTAAPAVEVINMQSRPNPEDARSAPANPTPAERPSQALLTRWQAYWQQAQEAGIEADDLVFNPTDTSASEAVRRLNALVQRIADSKKLKAVSGTS